MKIAYSAKVISAGLCIIAFYLSLAASKKASNTYTVALRHLPVHLDPWHNQINVYSFIDFHVYYPLFTKSNRNGVVESHFLDTNQTKALNSNFDKFQLCLLANLKYSDGSDIEIDDLDAMLREAHKVQELLPPLKSIQHAKNCLIVSLDASDSLYFDKISGVSSTILKRSTLGNQVPVGRGAYRVSAFMPDSIALEAEKDESSIQFKHVLFRKVENAEEATALGIMDMNHLYDGALNSEETKGMKRFSKPILKTYAILVSINDKTLRTEFGRCFDRNGFRKILGFDLIPTPGFLPEGILGADVNFDSARASDQHSSNCFFRSKKASISFYNYNPKIQTSLERYFKEKQESTPFQVSVIPKKLNEIIAAAFKGETLLTLAGFDSSGSQAAQFGEASVYFESFFRNDHIVPTPLRDVESHVRSAISASNIGDKEFQYRAAHTALLRSGYVIPLGQIVQDQFYPANVANIVWEDQISGFPRIDLMTSE